MEIAINKIRPSKLNPRLEMGTLQLNELASSIREVGLIEPIIVRPISNQFEVVVGERRFRASQQAGLERVPAIVREYTDEEVVLLNLIENVHRQELSAIEKGKVCKYLIEHYPKKYPSQAALADRVGISKNQVSVWMRTVDIIPKEAQDYIAPTTISGEVPEGKIDYATAVKVGRVVEEPEKRVEVIKKFAEERLPVKERDEIIRNVAREPEKPIDQVVEEVLETPSELQFSASDRESLLNGSKTQTSRIEIPDRKIKTGATVYASISEPHIAELQITSIERKRLKYFDEEDAKREGCSDLKELKRRWQQTYSEWDENQLVYVIHFEKAERLKHEQESRAIAR
jgi:ParB family chromosome partitioning protein